MPDINNIKFYTKNTKNMSDKEISQVSDLFSNHYGIWGSDAGKDKSGKRIKLADTYYKNNLTNKDNTYVALAYDSEKLVGHAFYIRKIIKDKYISWVLQLVVHSDYRRISIGKKLLSSIWGFSDDIAWGLATSNPYTIKTLESATFRKVDLSYIYNNINIIKSIGSDVNFLHDDSYEVSKSQSIVNTNFHIDHSKIDEKIKNAYGDNWLFGKLPLGYEWLAFTFNEQPINNLDKTEFDNLITFSEKQLKEAYSRMDMQNQPWTKNTINEVKYIIDKLKLNGNERIADFGCGIGRHCYEFAKLGYESIGIDFSKTNINKANSKINETNKHLLSFKVCDCRTVDLLNKESNVSNCKKINSSSSKEFNLILCLYDVIGSFPNESDNFAIIANIYNHLAPKGFAVISVMNMELTNEIAIHKDSILSNPKSLLNLKPSTIMQNDGNVFDPNYFLIDIDTNLVYRKEQFQNDGILSQEHVIRDKRYTKEEISTMVQRVGFKIIDCRFVSATDWNKPLKSTQHNAKEILLFLQK